MVATCRPISTHAEARKLNAANLVKLQYQCISSTEIAQYQVNKTSQTLINSAEKHKQEKSMKVYNETVRHIQ